MLKLKKTSRNKDDQGKRLTLIIITNDELEKSRPNFSKCEYCNKTPIYGNSRVLPGTVV